MTTHLQGSLMLDSRRVLDGIGAPFLHSSAVDVFASMLFTIENALAPTLLKF